LKITIKTRVWLLGLLLLGGMLSLIVQHFRMSGAELARHAEAQELLRQTGYFSRLIHEVQRERGLSSGYLTGRDDQAVGDLTAQQVATDFKLRDLKAALPDRPDTAASLEGMRKKIIAREVTQREAFDYYTVHITEMLGGIERLALSVGDHPMQPDLVAHAHLIQAKEFLGQARATLMALPQDGMVDPLWIAALGRHVGLFDWHVSLFLQGASADLASTMRGALAEPDMLQAQRLIESAMSQRTQASGQPMRSKWYETLTAAIDLLREMERYSLAGLSEKAEKAQADARFAILQQQAGFLLVASLLFYLAMSSLRLMLHALETALKGARRAAVGRNGPRLAAVQDNHDEVGEISQGVGDLLDLVDRLNLQASTDALTEALNRYGFAEIAQGELLRARRYHRSLSMIFLDFDHFKEINDLHGHAIGDRVLQEATRLVRDNLRLADVLVRWGGEEFVILAPETSSGEATLLAEKLRGLFREFRAEGLPRFTASFGVATYAPDDDLDSLFARADRALYAAKQGGRDRVVEYRKDKPAAAA
jgi:diguanylate cyclase (GGDEF)-like protein